VHGLAPRHRRKAGSGPPASALIAWVGADPHLRRALAAAAGRRRETDLPSPANTRAAKAAVVACFVLACGAVLGVTATVNDGHLVPPTTSPSALLGQSDAAVPEGAPSDWPIPLASPPAVDVAPSTERSQPPPPLPVPPAPAHVGHLTPDEPGRPGAYTPSPAATSAAHPTSSPRTDKPNGHPLRPATPGATVKPGVTGASVAPGATGTAGAAGSAGARGVPGSTPGPGPLPTAGPPSPLGSPSTLPH